jgi:hypothetical protein
VFCIVLRVAVGERFSGSVEASAVVDVTLNAAAALVYTHASCSAFDITADVYEMSKSLSDEMTAALAALPVGVDATTLHGKAALRTFIATYGTHVPVKVSIGGSATQKTTFESATLRALIAGGVDVDAVANAGIDLFELLLAGGRATASGSATANAR